MNTSQIVLIVLTCVGVLLMITSSRSGVYNKKRQINEYTGFGSTLNDALNGRKYRYDILMSSESKEKNDNKNEYVF
jgi:hypothetical protein